MGRQSKQTGMGVGVCLALDRIGKERIGKETEDLVIVIYEKIPWMEHMGHVSFLVSFALSQN